MWVPMTPKEKKQSVKALLKKVELEYKTTVKEADKKCAALRRDAEQQAERERADTKARKDLADKIAKEEYAQTKAEAAKIHIQTVMDIVREAIMEIKDRNLQQQPELMPKATSFSGDIKRSPSTASHSSSSAPTSSFPTSTSTFQYPPQGSYSNQYYGYTMSSNTSCSSSSSSSSSSSILSTGGNAKDDAEIREWVEYAADKLEAHMSRNQTRQRILEEVAGAALVREQTAQQEAAQRTRELEAEVRQLRLLQEQVLLQQQMGQLQMGEHVQGGGEGGEVAPPAYIAEDKKGGENDHKS